jgi:MinD-like ATPase involved in chromosome partitioning or flagellar assembly
MTNPKKPKKFLSLDDVRIYPNRDNNTFNLIASTDEIPGGFMLTLPAGAMEAKVREYFQNSGVSEPQQTDDSKLPDAAYLTYGEKPVPANDASKRKAQHILSNSDFLYEPGMGCVIAVTSPKGGAGKTTTSVLLGSTLASAKHEAGRPLKVVVVDCDVNDPGLQHLFAPEDLDRVDGLDIPDMVDENDGLKEMSDTDFLAHTAYSRSLGIHTLFTRPTAFDHIARHPDIYRMIIERLRWHFDVIILDTGGYPHSSISSETAFPLAHKILVVNPNLQSAAYIKKWIDDVAMFSSLGLPEVDHRKVSIIAMSSVDFSSDASFKRPWANGDATFKSTYYEMKFIGNVPLDTNAVQHAANFRRMADILRHHPYFGDAYKAIATKLMSDRTVTFPELAKDGEPVVKADDDCVLVGVRPNGKPLAIDFLSGRAENGVSQGIFITHDEENAPSALIENLLEFVKNKRPGKEVITCGLPGDLGSQNSVNGVEVVRYGLDSNHRSLNGNLELLSILRSLAADAREGNDISDKVLFLGDSSSDDHNSNHDWVDKAVLSEIHALIAGGLKGKMQIVMVASKPKASMSVMATNSPDYVCIHFGSKRRVRSTDEFLRKVFGKDIVGLSAHWPKNRAYVKASNYEGLIQVFEVKE